jgi:hypothetical protein
MPSQASQPQPPSLPKPVRSALSLHDLLWLDGRRRHPPSLHDRCDLFHDGSAASPAWAGPALTIGFLVMAVVFIAGVAHAETNPTSPRNELLAAGPASGHLANRPKAGLDDPAVARDTSALEGELASPATAPLAFTYFLPMAINGPEPASPGGPWTGQIVNTFSNCGLTRLFGFTLDQYGDLVGDIWVRYWADGWEGAWARSLWEPFGTNTSWKGDEGNWDGVLDTRPREAVWHVCVVPGEGSWTCLSNEVDAVTSYDCHNDIQIVVIDFQQGEAGLQFVRDLR